jgi:hypothetical protein
MLALHALAHRALLSVCRSVEPVEQRAMQAIELAREHGWEEAAPEAAASYAALGGANLWRGRLREAESWLELPERVLEHNTQPTAAMLYATRGLLAFTRGQHTEAGCSLSIGIPSGWTLCLSCRTCLRRACKRSSSRGDQGMTTVVELVVVVAVTGVEVPVVEVPVDWPIDGMTTNDGGPGRFWWMVTVDW